jgi:hypothetical protein
LRIALGFFFASRPALQNDGSRSSAVTHLRGRRSTMDEKYGKRLGVKIEVATRKTYVVLHG